MASSISTYSFTMRLLRWFYKPNEIPAKPSEVRKKALLMYLLIVPYWVFTLPGCFLEGTFCNLKRKNKIGLSVIGYLLFLIAGCILLYPISFFIVLPNSAWVSIALYASKAWLVIGAYGICIITLEYIKVTIRIMKLRKRRKRSYFDGKALLSKLYEANQSLSHVNWQNENTEVLF